MDATHTTVYFDDTACALIHSCFGVVFVIAKKNDQMSKRQAEPVTESAAAKTQGSAQSLRVRSSLSKFVFNTNVNSWMNRAVIDPEQKTNSLDSHVQKSQTSDEAHSIGHRDIGCAARRCQ